MGVQASRFKGVRLEELGDLEQLFSTNIVVYSLNHEERDDEIEEQFPPEIVATLVRRSHRHYPDTMYLDLYENHFSYIKNLSKYYKSFKCSKRGKLRKHAGKLQPLELTCEAKTRLNFPGNAYVVPPTIFDQLSDEGINVPEHLRYFQHFATFDFEVCFQRTIYPRTPTIYSGRTFMITYR